jgi:hypothetical protein
LNLTVGALAFDVVAPAIAAGGFAFDAGVDTFIKALIA